MYIKLYFIDIILCFSYKKIVIIIVNLFYKLRLINMIKKKRKKKYYFINLILHVFKWYIFDYGYFYV